MSDPPPCGKQETPTETDGIGRATFRQVKYKKDIRDRAGCELGEGKVGIAEAFGRQGEWSPNNRDAKMEDGGTESPRPQAS